MTAFPIGVIPEFSLVRQDGNSAGNTILTFKPRFAVPEKGSCVQFGNIEQMAAIRWELPKTLTPGRYAIRAGFCGVEWEAMPVQIETPEIEIRR
ncbi:MAG: hypothetical protein RBR01_06410, partial [Desulfobacterales bacterium]|jgi:hypothetical protein|nr:hypothetical protein [Desulfobacterales bacterium]